METRIVILGGGQLGRMTALAAYRLGFEIGVLSSQADDPATNIACQKWIGSWNNKAILDGINNYATVITLENEFVDCSALSYLETCGAKVYPSLQILAAIQDKFLQKQALQAAGLPIPRFFAVNDTTQVVEYADQLGWPLMLKARRNGYDGYGNELVRKPEDLEAAFTKLSKSGMPLMIEEFIPFTKELAVMVARSTLGEEVIYPVVETIQHAHMCHTVLAPASISENSLQRAKELGQQVVSALNGVGIFGIEMFLLNDGNILINEVAPRPHNSGHFSIEGCYTSQFENHVRAILGLPLGVAELVIPAVAMVNILGTSSGPTKVRGLEEALKIPKTHVHLYGKKFSRPGRKMGHVTATAKSLADAHEAALRAARLIKI